MLAARYSGYNIDPVIPGMLMGGSVVGISYQLGKMVKKTEWILRWKVASMTIGFLVAHSLLMFKWFDLVIYSAIALCIGFMAIGSRYQKDTKAIENIEKSMKSCC